MAPPQPCSANSWLRVSSSTTSGRHVRRMWWCHGWTGRLAGRPPTHNDTGGGGQKLRKKMRKIADKKNAQKSAKSEGNTKIERNLQNYANLKEKIGKFRKPCKKKCKNTEKNSPPIHSDTIGRVISCHVTMKTPAPPPINGIAGTPVQPWMALLRSLRPLLQLALRQLPQLLRREGQEVQDLVDAAQELGGGAPCAGGREHRL